LHPFLLFFSSLDIFFFFTFLLAGGVLTGVAIASGFFTGDGLVSAFGGVFAPSAFGGVFVALRFFFGLPVPFFLADAGVASVFA